MRKQVAHDLPAVQRLLRRVAAGLAALILPCRVVDENGGLARAETLLDAGYGLIVLVNHFSTRDGPQVLALLGRNRTMRRRTFVGPAAHHQLRRHVLLVRVLGALLAIRLYPVITPHAAGLYRRQRRQGDGLATYLQAASASLKRGSIILLAPQARRRRYLGIPPTGRPVAKLLTQAEADQVQRIGLVFIGLSIPHHADYSLSKVGGVNLFRRYAARVGSTVTLAEALRESQGMSAMDDWVFARLRDLVPEAYGTRAGAEAARTSDVMLIPERNGGAK